MMEFFIAGDVVEKEMERVSKERLYYYKRSLLT
jgi:hypothetical protein